MLIIIFYYLSIDASTLKVCIMNTTTHNLCILCATLSSLCATLSSPLPSPLSLARSRPLLPPPSLPLH